MEVDQYISSVAPRSVLLSMCLPGEGWHCRITLYTHNHRRVAPSKTDMLMMEYIYPCEWDRNGVAIVTHFTNWLWVYYHGWL